MKLKNKILIFLTLFLSWPCLLNAEVFISWKGSNSQLINKYLKIQKNFSSVLCAQSADSKYYKIFADYRGEGYFIPIAGEKSLDVKTIQNHLLKLKGKMIWLEGLVFQVRQISTFVPLQLSTKSIHKHLNYLLKLRRIIWETDFDSERKRVNKEAKQELEKFKFHWKSYLGEIFFLLSYNFPVDHFDLRKKYDKYKKGLAPEDKELANDVYFYRKIVEDGAQNPNHQGSDKFLRATLNSIFLRLDSITEFLSEDLRYDLFYALSKIEKLLKKGKKAQLLRLKEWLGRTKKTYDFYKKLLVDDEAVAKKKNITRELLRKKSSAKYKLVNFVADKQKKVYLFWQKYKEIYRALYSIETILFNEVGRVDGEDALERRDVVQIILNRKLIPIYTQLNYSQKLNLFLEQEQLGLSKKYPWLNLLFKEGEFSFTYYFIPSSVKVFCPDMSRSGRKLRKQNLKIALELLAKPNMNFRALRYFSRAGMLGKVDMTALWGDYQAINERVGNKVRYALRAKSAYRRGEYTYFYDFRNPQGKLFYVVEIEEKTYAIHQSGRQLYFYKYRNPHYFKYFKVK